jgi:hypothetical protein
LPEKITTVPQQHANIYPDHTGHGKTGGSETEGSGATGGFGSARSWTANGDVISSGAHLGLSNGTINGDTPNRILDGSVDRDRG